MDRMVTLITILGSTGLLTSLCTFVGRLIEEKRRRSCVTILGVVGKLPSSTMTVLAPYPDFTDIRKAIRSGYSFVVLHCRMPSYALRKCDFVVMEGGHDEKIIEASDTNRIASILPDDKYGCSVRSIYQKEESHE